MSWPFHLRRGACRKGFSRSARFMSNINSRACWKEIWRLITDVDLLISEQKPWTLAEDAAKRAQLDTVLWIAADTLRAVAVLAHPVIPMLRRNCGGRWDRADPSESSGSTSCNGESCGPELRLRKRRHCFRESKNKKLSRGWKRWKANHRSR